MVCSNSNTCVLIYIFFIVSIVEHNFWKVFSGSLVEITEFHFHSRRGHQPVRPDRAACQQRDQAGGGRLCGRSSGVPGFTRGHSQEPGVLPASQGGALCPTVGHHVSTAPLH